jgi:hypothetical protein
MNEQIFNVIISNKAKLKKRKVKIINALNEWLVLSDSTLESLYLADCQLESSLNDLIGELGSFKKLKLLDISGNGIGKNVDFNSFHLLSKSLQANNSLEILMFDGSFSDTNKPEDMINAYTHIFNALKRFGVISLFIRS